MDWISATGVWFISISSPICKSSVLIEGLGIRNSPSLKLPLDVCSSRSRTCENCLFLEERGRFKIGFGDFLLNRGP